LKANFARFNFEIHKEKEMVSFRKYVLAIAVLALFTGLASAQVIGGTGSTAGPLTCAAQVTNPTSARQEGFTELLGDIVIQCTGGVVATAGSAVPTANIVVALSQTTVTSRVFSNGLSESLLFIDEPGSATATPASALPQTLCTLAGGSTPSNVGASFGGCATFANTATTGVSTAATCTAFSGASCTTFGPVPNVFQGTVNNNQVIFNGIPILAPGTTGFTRVFRITNVRANAAALAGLSGAFQGVTPIQANISISNGILLTNPQQTAAFLFPGLVNTSGSSAVRNAGGGSITAPAAPINVLQCNTTTLTNGSVLRFTEGFASAFKTRVAPTATTSGAGTALASTAFVTPTTQNVPGFIFNGSESGLVFNAGGNTAGLADFGTRLKATFNNVPSGVSIFVSTTNVNPQGNTGVNLNVGVNFGGLPALANGNIPLTLTNAQSLLAGLVLGEATTSPQGGFLPIQGGTNNINGVNVFGPLPVDAGGTATAVWEILQTNPSVSEVAEFGIFFTLNGNPANNTPAVLPGGTVALSFAPTGSTVGFSSVIPRFTNPSTTTPFVSVALCQTTLLFPFVNTTPGFDTGIAIANTSADPFGTKTQSGTCSLNFFGSGAGTTTTTTFPSPATAGGTSNPIQPGTIMAEQVSSIRPGFQGYIIAVCNFQLAHGYALFSDTGIRNWATGYLALVLPTGNTSRNTGNLLQGPGAPGAVEGAGQ